MGTIFISYRRGDSAGHTGRLFDSLRDRFGKASVYRDIEDLEPGVDFIDSIDQALIKCDILLVIIGAEWISASDQKGRRLDNPDDFVRMEVAKALERNVRVIPVLVAGATMPDAEELPEDLCTLARRNAIELSDTRWDYDIGRLGDTLAKVLGALDQAEPGGASTHAPVAAPQQEPVVPELVVPEQVVREPVVREQVVREPVARERIAREPVARERIAWEPAPQEKKGGGMLGKLGVVLAGVVVLVVVVSLLLFSDQTAEHRTEDLNTQPAFKSPVDDTGGAVTAGDSSYDVTDSDQTAEDRTAALATELAASDLMEVPASLKTAKNVVTDLSTIRKELDFVTCTEVDQLKPLGIGKVFPPGRVYVFARVYAPKEESLTLKLYGGDGKELWEGHLNVRRNMATGFRTYAYKTLYEAGSYEVRLFNSDQVEMGRRQFNISET